MIAGLYNPDPLPLEARLSPERLAQEIARRCAKNAVYLPKVEAIVEHVATGAQPGDVVVIMSNGGFGGIHEKLLEALRGAPPPVLSPLGERKDLGESARKRPSPSTGEG